MFYTDLPNLVFEFCRMNLARDPGPSILNLPILHGHAGNLNFAMLLNTTKCPETHFKCHSKILTLLNNNNDNQHSFIQQL